MIRLANSPLKLTVADWRRVARALGTQRGAADNLRRVIEKFAFVGHALEDRVLLLLTAREKALAEAVLGRGEGQGGGESGC